MTGGTSEGNKEILAGLKQSMLTRSSLITHLKCQRLKPPNQFVQNLLELLKSFQILCQTFEMMAGLDKAGTQCDNSVKTL